MSVREYDVIVVGAGPAGATAAFHLGAAGQRVLVLEKERLPRHKPCAGGVPTSVLRRFPVDFSPVVERAVRRVRFRFADGREVAADLPQGAVVTVRRDRFDHYLVSQARAEVRDDAPVADIRQDDTGVEAVLASGEAIRARYLILADGANSRLARRVGLRREIGSDLLWGLQWAPFFYAHPRVSFEWGVRNPLFLREFLRLFAWRTTYRAMALRAPFLVVLGALCCRKPEAHHDRASEP